MSSEPADRTSRAAAELLALAEQAGRLGIVEWDVPSGKVSLSSHCLELYGLDRFNFDGRYDTLLACVYREDQPRATARIEQAFADREPQVEVDYRIVRPNDGELRWIEARRLIFYDAAGAPQRVVGVSVDVTEQKRAAAQLRAFTETLEESVRARTYELEAQHEARRKAEDLLRQSQKMEAVGQLTGGVAHDFNNLLTVIMGGLDVIGRELAKLGEVPSAARIARARDLALQGTQRAAILTNRLLAFSRQQALDPRPLDANRLVADTAELLRRTLGEAIALETVLAGGLWLAFADQNQLETAILNLAVNARDAMPEGGKMTIETANTYLDEAYAKAVAEPVEPGQYVLIAVADTGSGMDSSALERAFEPFFTTKAAGRGTGLGLSQVYGFVRQSSGHVRIYSEPGHGTTVKLYLPRHQGADAHAPAAERATGAARAIGRETILVVEDDEALRVFAVEALGELGYRVLHAADAQIGARHPRRRTRDRPAVHRRGDAGRHERTTACRRGGEASAHAQGAVHHGLYAQCHHPSWPARSGRESDRQALYVRGTRRSRADAAGPEKRIGPTAVMPTVKDVTYDLLRKLDLTTIVGNPGSTEETFLKDFPDDFRYVLALQEASVLGIADGLSQGLRKPVIVNIHTAAGLGNAMGGLLSAYQSKTPLIVTAGQQSREMLLLEPLLANIDAVTMPRPWVKWSYEPARPQDVPAAFMRAYATALQPPAGPVFLSLPLDDWDKEMPADMLAATACAASPRASAPIRSVWPSSPAASTPAPGRSSSTAPTSRAARPGTRASPSPSAWGRRFGPHPSPNARLFRRPTGCMPASCRLG